MKRSSTKKLNNEELHLCKRCKKYPVETEEMSGDEKEDHEIQKADPGSKKHKSVDHDRQIGSTMADHTSKGKNDYGSSLLDTLNFYCLKKIYDSLEISDVNKCFSISEDQERMVDEYKNTLEYVTVGDEKILTLPGYDEYEQDRFIDKCEMKRLNWEPSVEQFCRENNYKRLQTLHVVVEDFNRDLTQKIISLRNLRYLFIKANSVASNWINLILERMPYLEHFGIVVGSHRFSGKRFGKRIGRTQTVLCLPRENSITHLTIMGGITLIVYDPPKHLRHLQVYNNQGQIQTWPKIETFWLGPNLSHLFMINFLAWQMTSLMDLRIFGRNDDICSHQDSNITSLRKLNMTSVKTLHIGQYIGNCIGLTNLSLIRCNLKKISVLARRTPNLIHLIVDVRRTGSGELANCFQHWASLQYLKITSEGYSFLNFIDKFRNRLNLLTNLREFHLDFREVVDSQKIKGLMEMLVQNLRQTVVHIRITTRNPQRTGNEVIISYKGVNGRLIAS